MPSKFPANFPGASSSKKGKKRTASYWDGDEGHHGKKQSDYRRQSGYQTLFEYFNPECR